MSALQSTVEYRDVPGWPGYRVGSDGSIWSRRSINGRGPLKDEWRLMKQSVGKRGRKVVSLCCDGRRALVHVHKLVLLAFVGPCPPGMECRHFPDPDPTNNTLSNLQWGTRKQNAEDSVAQGIQVRGELCHRSKLTADQVKEVRAKFAAGGRTKASLAREYNIAATNITRIIERKVWTHI